MGVAVVALNSKEDADYVLEAGGDSDENGMLDPDRQNFG